MASTSTGKSRTSSAGRKTSSSRSTSGRTTSVRRTSAAASERSGGTKNSQDKMEMFRMIITITAVGLLVLTFASFFVKGLSWIKDYNFFLYGHLMYPIPFILLLALFFMLYREMTTDLLLRYLAIFIAIFSVSGIISAVMTGPDGGLLGRFSNLVFVNMFGTVGTCIIHVIFLAIAFVLFVQQTPYALFGRTGGDVKAYEESKLAAREKSKSRAERTRERKSKEAIFDEERRNRNRENLQREKSRTRELRRQDRYLSKSEKILEKNAKRQEKNNLHELKNLERYAQADRIMMEQEERREMNRDRFRPIYGIGDTTISSNTQALPRTDLSTGKDALQENRETFSAVTGGNVVNEILEEQGMETSIDRDLLDAEKKAADFTLEERPKRRKGRESNIPVSAISDAFSDEREGSVDMDLMEENNRDPKQSEETQPEINFRIYGYEESERQAQNLSADTGKNHVAAVSSETAGTGRKRTIVTAAGRILHEDVPDTAYSEKVSDTDSGFYPENEETEDPYRYDHLEETVEQGVERGYIYDAAREHDKDYNEIIRRKSEFEDEFEHEFGEDLNDKEVIRAGQDETDSDFELDFDDRQTGDEDIDRLIGRAIEDQYNEFEDTDQEDDPYGESYDEESYDENSYGENSYDEESHEPSYDDTDQFFSEEETVYEDTDRMFTEDSESYDEENVFMDDSEDESEEESSVFVKPSGKTDDQRGTASAAVPVKPMVKKEEVRKEYVFPPLDLLKKGPGNADALSDQKNELQRNAEKLQETLATFGVNVTVTNVTLGPTVTRYELLPEVGVKVSKITSLEDDIKLNMAATDIRIEAPIPGKAAIGIEIPNRTRKMIYLRELLEMPAFKESRSKLAFTVGKNIEGDLVIGDISKMPHLLVAGSTGSGKSVFINTMIMSILYHAKPTEVQMILIDPKVVEFAVYNGIPHLLMPVVDKPKNAANALIWAVNEMERRYQNFADYCVRGIDGFNALCGKPEYTDDNGDMLKPMPRILIIVDELADLMMAVKQDVETSIARLAQKARAAGIHLVLATQTPRVDVVTGLIKANIPSRAALLVSNGTDSRVILDEVGAEKLVGNGDMLYAPAGISQPIRMQGAFVSDDEINDVVAFIKGQKEVMGGEMITLPDAASSDTQAVGKAGGPDRDEYFVEAGRLVIGKDKCSIGMLQRAFKLGFNRAARIVDQLCDAGVVGEEEGTKPRKVLMKPAEFEAYIKNEGL